MRHRASAIAATHIVAGVAAVMTCASLAPALLAEGFPVGHDTTAHLTYLYLFDAALAQGQFPVRWIEWIRAGHSQPLFSFYQPGFYYAVQLVHAVVPSLLLSAKLTLIAAWWAGGALVYVQLRSLGVWPAVLGALVFVRNPYLILDVFVRAAFPEFLALTCAPAVLWSLDRTLRSSASGWALVLAVSSAAMLLLHLPTVLMFLPVFATYTAVMWISGRCRGRSVAKVAVAVGLGLGMACFYVAPALLELQFTKMRELTSAYFDYRQHFVEPWQWFSVRWGYGGSESGPSDGMSFQVGIVQWLAIGGGLGAAAIAMRSGRRDAGMRLVYWLAVALAALLMTSAISAVIWNAVPALAFIQFPWRFLTVVSLTGGIVAALALSSVRSPFVQAIVVICAATGLVWQTQDLVKPSHYLPRASMYIDNPGWRLSRDAEALAFIEPGYYPSTVTRLPAASMERWEITGGEGEVTPVRVRDDRLALRIRSGRGVELTIRSHGFPGWRVSIDGRPAEWSYERELGFIVVDVPPGTHAIDAIFGDTAVRAWANGISLVSVLSCGAAVVMLGIGRMRRTRV
jgi:hypothetical protein